MLKNIKAHAFLPYTFFTGVDKALNCLLPLSILYFFHSNVLYAKAEYIYSWVGLVAPLMDLGFRYYLFYGYSKANNKDSFLGSTQSIFFIWLCFYLVLFFCSSLIVRDVLFVFFSFRLIFYFCANYFNIYFRLIEKPSKVYLVTISISILALLLLILAKNIAINPLLAYYSAFFIGIVMIFGIVKIKKLYKKISLSEFFVHQYGFLRYSWPLMLNVIIVALVNNFGKIYIYHFLGNTDMAIFSLIQRLANAILLLHVSTIAFYSKSIYLGSFIKKIIMQYLVLLTSSTFVVLMAIYIILFKIGISIQDMIYIPLLIMGYFYFWCLTSFVELFFNRAGKTLYVLLVNLFTILIFTGIILSFYINMLLIAFAMFIAALSGFGFSIFFALRFSFNEQAGEEMS